MMKHLLDGVKKGALTQEQAEDKFGKWMEEKEGRIGNKRENLSKSAQEAKAKAKRELDKTLEKYGLKGKRSTGAASSPLQSGSYVRQGNTIPTSDRITRTEGKRDLIYEHLWKKDRQETKETVNEIQRKAKSIAPAYSKGSYQYITGDVKTLGRKI